MENGDEDGAEVEVTAELEVEAINAMTALVQEHGYTEAELGDLVKTALDA
jgi:hypothetical protein